MPKSVQPPDIDVPTHVDDLICFALHSTTHAMNRAYKPFLSKIGLTYPQYTALVALWEGDGVTVSTLCDRLMTETGTLTPILKRLEQQGHVTRNRAKDDERKVFIHLTESGDALRHQAPDITRCVMSSTGLPSNELSKLVETLARMREHLGEHAK